MNKVYITKSSNETKNLAKKLVQKLEGGEILLLYGNLGGGKTTFVQGLAEGLGIEERIISPTFIIIRKYQISNIKYQISNFYHVDLYRVQGSKEIDELGLSEILNDKESIVAIEWAERLASLPKKRIEINFEYISENERRITVNE